MWGREEEAESFKVIKPCVFQDSMKFKDYKILDHCHFKKLRLKAAFWLKFNLVLLNSIQIDATHR